MAKAQQSKSKSAYRGWIGYTAKVIALFAGSLVESSEDVQSKLIEAYSMLYDAQTEIFDGVLFSSTANIDLWSNRFQERRDYALDKIRESLEKQLHTQDHAAEKEFEAAAKAFGTDVETYAEFLALDVSHGRGSQSSAEERRTAYVKLRDVMNVYTKIARFIIFVRYDGKYYHVAMGSSGGARRSHRRSRSQKKSKKTLRF